MKLWINYDYFLADDERWRKRAICKLPSGQIHCFGTLDESWDSVREAMIKKLEAYIDARKDKPDDEVVEIK